MDIDALETSFDLVAPRVEELMEIFNARLFEAAPAVRPLFAGTDLKRQPAMLLSALVLLRDLDAVVPTSCTSSARGMSPTAPRQRTIPWSARWCRGDGGGRQGRMA
ncbi:MAG: hypothetical protein QOI98_636 [Solirubrobacteraceae bacterium]|nr:hypothetical protein [Solirubrobacteraceae bacterium]